MVGSGHTGEPAAITDPHSLITTITGPPGLHFNSKPNVPKWNRKSTACGLTVILPSTCPGRNRIVVVITPICDAEVVMVVCVLMLNHEVVIVVVVVVCVCAPLEAQTQNHSKNDGRNFRTPFEAATPCSRRLHQLSVLHRSHWNFTGLVLLGWRRLRTLCCPVQQSTLRSSLR